MPTLIFIFTLLIGAILGMKYEMYLLGVLIPLAGVLVAIFIIPIFLSSSSNTKGYGREDHEDN